jgi:hypothetical protein
MLTDLSPYKPRNRRTNMKNITNTLKKYTKLIVGILGLGIVIAWSGGFLSKKVKPGVLEHQAGVAVPADAATVEVKAETAPVRVEVVGTTASEEKSISARASRPTSAKSSPPPATA